MQKYKIYFFNLLNYYYDFNYIYVVKFDGLYFVKSVQNLKIENNGLHFLQCPKLFVMNLHFHLYYTHTRHRLIKGTIFNKYY
jgi:hypothetical protein